MIARALIALVAGALFGAGLALSGMTDPERVRGFLDLFGAWDPTLAFVMGGALLPMTIAWAIQKRCAAPLADDAFDLPETHTIDRRLLAGSTLFGVGWGLSGLCPGPAIADLALAPSTAVILVAAMLAGFGLQHVLFRSRIKSEP